MSYQDQRKAVQRALQPFYQGPIDGDLGPLSDAAYRDLRTATEAPDNPRAAIAHELMKLVGHREVTSNRSPEIDALWPYTSYPTGYLDRQPYCAATICACAARAALVEPRLAKSPLPKSAGVAGLLDWARHPKNKCLVFSNSGKIKPLIGDIFIMLPNVSHTGLVAADYDGRSGNVQTLEGNTNSAGGREGDGFWSKTRPLSTLKTFIRLAANA